MAARPTICGQIAVRGGGSGVCPAGAPLDHNRDGHRGGFGRFQLQSDTTTPLFPLEVAGVREDFLHGEKKRKKEKELRKLNTR
jgi:hypothetical protein